MKKFLFATVAVLTLSTAGIASAASRSECQAFNDRSVVKLPACPAVAVSESQMRAYVDAAGAALQQQLADYKSVRFRNVRAVHIIGQAGRGGDDFVFCGEAQAHTQDGQLDRWRAFYVVPATSKLMINSLDSAIAAAYCSYPIAVVDDHDYSAELGRATLGEPLSQ